MIELELFYKIVESEIRRKHIKFLKNQKCLPSDQVYSSIPIVLKPNETTETTDSTKTADSVPDDPDEFIFSDKPKSREKVKRVKAFNKGIEAALKVLFHSYKRYSARFPKD